MKSYVTLAGAVASAALLAAPAAAHTATGNGMAAGFLHPLTGLDHLLAMVAVGIWGAFLGRPLLYVLPVVFPMMMAVGAVLGMAGLPVPPVELGIAVSVLLLGAAICLAWRAPIIAAVGLVAIFALFHGYAHGAELPLAASPVLFSLGFVVATGLLHVAGIAIGTLSRYSWGPAALRVAGGAIAIAGAAFMVPALS